MKRARQGRTSRPATGNSADDSGWEDGEDTDRNDSEGVSEGDPGHEDTADLNLEDLPLDPEKHHIIAESTGTLKYLEHIERSGDPASQVSLFATAMHQLHED